MVLIRVCDLSKPHWCLINCKMFVIGTFCWLSFYNVKLFLHCMRPRNLTVLAVFLIELYMLANCYYPKLAFDENFVMCTCFAIFWPFFTDFGQVTWWYIQTVNMLLRHILGWSTIYLLQMSVSTLEGNTLITLSQYSHNFFEKMPLNLRHMLHAKWRNTYTP